jgi:hypothetical protein
MNSDHTAVEIEDGDGDDDWIDKGDEEIITSEGQKLDDYGRCFVDAVYGRLPFKKCKTSPKLAYTWVLLDEQRFIGKRVSCIMFQAHSPPQAHNSGLERWPA